MTNKQEVGLLTVIGFAIALLFVIEFVSGCFKEAM